MLIWADLDRVKNENHINGESMQKLALITGASSGIGAEASRELARLGYRVILLARTKAKLVEVASSIGPAASIEICDAGSGQEVLEMANRVRQEYGVPDVIVNSAGLGQWKRIEGTTPGEAREMIAAPYLSAFNVTHAFMREMLQRRSGTIIHVNSPACYMAWPGAVAYTAARCALRGLHEALRQDLTGTGVKSCHVVFGRVDSEYFTNNTGIEAQIPKIANTIPTLTVGDCARVIGKIASAPRNETIYPFMLRFYYWNNLVIPWFVRWLLRVTGSKN